MRLPKKGLLLLPVLLLPIFPAWSQSAADVESLLAQKEITFEQAAFFTCSAALNEPPATPSEAFAQARDRGWLPAQAESSGAVTMGGLSLLVMKAFDLNGGMMYRFFGNQRYAYREMKDRGYITGRAYQRLAVSGEQFLQILGDVTADLGGEL